MSCCSFLFLFPADVGDEELGVCHAAVFCFYSQLMLVMRARCMSCCSFFFVFPADVGDES